MKILPWSAAVFAAAIGFSVGCGSGGCGGTNLNNNNSAPVVTCGPGTVQQAGVCVPTTGTQTR
jgi:hypothetical protein